MKMKNQREANEEAERKPTERTKHLNEKKRRSEI